ncbi:hypothetical protein K0T92_12075 [Paenibacillus oenotherae]|uniref:Uncharacterized protein n=1 Tax=Paenibacillus oenotherae TaxID=1435645 RepID=A0ABS7D6D1_9BACL|nr:hypothetical protein [Paenibacillus oenotherae]MBW7475488.1 hypothetical protein [Paenibacillus oenotherae]
MDRDEQIAFIVTELEQLDNKNRTRLEDACKVHCGHTGSLSETNLHEWRDEHLNILYSIMQGVRMTREYVPDMAGAYANVDSMQSRVSFGQVFGKRDPD